MVVLISYFEFGAKVSIESTYLSVPGRECQNTVSQISKDAAYGKRTVVDFYTKKTVCGGG